MEPSRTRRVVRLVPVDAACEPIELAPGRSVLGRTASGTLSDMSISRQHAAFEWDPATGSLVGEDAGGRIGSWIDGVSLASSPRPFGDGSVVRLGDLVLVVELGAQPEDAPGIAPEAVPGRSAAARRLRTELAAAAADPSPLLLAGDTGVGKQRIARELHHASGRPGPFLVLNCAELAPELVETQVFGHARRGFNGTLLLDDIIELPPRVFQERMPKEMRVIAATSRDLSEVVAELMIWQVRVPSLRARRVDIPMWFHRLLGGARPAGASGFELEADVVEALVLAPWPDNLRGLDRLVHKIASASGLELATLQTFLGSLAAPRPSPGRTPPPTTDELRAAVGDLGNSVHAVARPRGTRQRIR